MIKRLSLLLLFACSTANAQFVTGQILTAQQLNNAFANVLTLTGGTLTGPLTVPTMTVTGNLTVNGTFTAPGAISPASLAPQVPNSLIGNVSNNTQSPGVVGLPSCNSSTNALNYANGAGFVCNTNINASTLGGQIFAAPGPIGSQVASTGAFTNLTATGTVTLPSASVALSNLSAQGANTVVANVTGSSASPTAFPMPSCSTANSVLQYTSSTGFTCVVNGALTTGTLAQFAATTSAQLAGVVSDETGSGALVFGTSPTLNTPTISTPAIANGTMSGTAITNSPISGNAGSFTTLGATGALSGAGFTNFFASPPAIGSTAANTGAFTTISASGLITPSSTVGIKGTATNDSAQAGSIGEYASNSTATTSATSGTTLNATSTASPLAAGDWDVQCSAQFNPAASTVLSVIFVSVNTTSATNGPLGAATQLVIAGSTGFVNGQIQIIESPVVRVSLASAATIFCPSFASFTTSTLTISGFIRARRVR